MNNVFGLDIGTRNVVGTVGHRTEDGAFIVEAQYVRQHETRSMLDGQIHDIGKVARTISAVKAELGGAAGCTAFGSVYCSRRPCVKNRHYACGV